jgi:hypothetical protein
MNLFEDALKRVVMFAPYGPDRLNCFSKVTTFSEFSENCFGATYEDYVNGDYYAREWVGAGASRENMRTEFNALTIYEQHRGGGPFASYIVNILAPVAYSDDATNHGKPRTKRTASRSCFANAQYVLQQLSKYYLFEFIDGTGNEYSAYCSEQYAAWLLSSQGYQQARNTARKLDASIMGFKDIKITANTFDEIGIVDVMGCFMEFRVKNCFDIEAEEQFFNEGELKVNVTNYGGYR